LAVETFNWALEKTEQRWGSWDVPWGEVHRVRRGEVDASVSGCGGSLGCFRVLWFEEGEDGKLVVEGGDGWIMAVEMGNPPRALSILGYGQSNQPESPYHDNQAGMFAKGEMKMVAFTEQQIDKNVIRRYHPGDEGSASNE